MQNRMYLCIDLKSFYASVECVERGLDPMTTNLVVADPARTEKTICLAITPSMKAMGIHNRCRVYEIPKNVNYIMAPPRMQLYIRYSANIYAIYLKYIAKEDIQPYSIDEAFLDVTCYLHMYGMSEKELALKIMNDIKNTTGVTATCGIGTNLYLAKIALDIISKHVDDNIGILNEETFKTKLWNHKPLKDFWRIGPGISRRLETLGIYTMEQIAHAEESILYRIFGVDAELMIDHAWGRETTTIEDIKAYKPKANSVTSSQVLPRNYTYTEALLIVKEMTDLLCLELVDRGLATKSISMMLGYTYELQLPSSRGTIALSITTDSSRIIIDKVVQLYKQIAIPSYPIRRINISFNNIVEEVYQQLNLFVDPVKLERDRRIQRAVLDIKKKYGKNAILKGMNLQEAARTIERNNLIGGHKDGSVQ